VGCARILHQPVGRFDQALREQINVEAEVSRVRIHGFLFSCEEINE
jgi:hypothetical protein